MTRTVQGNDILKLSLTGETPSDGTDNKTMKVSFELTAGGKVINGRIYTPAAVAGSLDSWVKPVAKPILLYHRDDTDPIGRIGSVRIEDTEQEALSALDGNYVALSEIKGAYNTNDAKKIYKVMSKYGLLNNPKWPGLTRLIADANIVSPEAVQKFADERYINFSAGQDFHTFVCGKDGQDWIADGPCEHVPATMGGSGKDSTTMVVTSSSGREASVVNNPANSTSYVREKTLMGSDSAITDKFSSEDLDDNEMFIGKDANIFFEDVERYKFGWTELEFLMPATVASMLNSDMLSIAKLDALEGTPSIEYIEQLKIYVDQSSGPINHWFSKFETIANDSEDEMPKEEFEALKNEVSQLTSTVADLVSKLVSAAKPIDSDDEVVNDDTIDWDLLDLALEAEVARETPDAKLTAEKRKSLKSSTFCGPNKSFPVPDCAHVTAARRLIGRAKHLSSSQKSAVLSCVSRKAKGLGCDTADAPVTTDVVVTEAPVVDAQATDSQDAGCGCGKTKDADCRCKDFDSLQVDYTTAMTTIDTIKATALDAYKKLAEAMHATVEVAEGVDALPIYEEWLKGFDFSKPTTVTTEGSDVIHTHPQKALLEEGLDAKTFVSEQTPERAAQNFSDFERSVLDTAIKIKEDRGIDAAKRYIMSQRRYLPRDVEIDKLLNMVRGE